MSPFLIRGAARHPHLQPPAPRPAETAAELQARQLAFLRELGELNMIAARDAAARIIDRADAAEAIPANAKDAAKDAAEPNPAPTTAGTDPTLALARATRSIATVFNLESRILAGETARTAPVTGPVTAEDPRADALRKLLHPLAADAVSDPVRRRTLRLQLNEEIDDALGADLDDSLSLADIAATIARRHGLRVNPARVADNYFFPASDPSCTNPLARLTPFAPDAPPGIYDRHPLPRGRLPPAPPVPDDS